MLLLPKVISSMVFMYTRQRDTRTFLSSWEVHWFQREERSRLNLSWCSSLINSLLLNHEFSFVFKVLVIFYSQWKNTVTAFFYSPVTASLRDLAVGAHTCSVPLSYIPLAIFFHNWNFNICSTQDSKYMSFSMFRQTDFKVWAMINIGIHSHTVINPFHVF